MIDKPVYRKINLQLFAEGDPEIKDDDFKLDETPAAEVEVKPEKPEEFDEIQYNKEVVKIPVSERQAYLQKGYNYDKVHNKLTDAEQEVQRRDAFVKRLGYESFAELEQAQAQRELEEQAASVADQNPGMTQETALRLIQLEQREKEREKKDQEATINNVRFQQRESLKNDSFFAEIDPLVQATLKQPNMENQPYDVVYNYICGRPEYRTRSIADNAKKLDEAQKLAEKRTIANIHDKKSRGISDSSDGELDNEVELTPEGKRMAAAFGNDPKEIAKYVKKQIRR